MLFLSLSSSSSPISTKDTVLRNLRNAYVSSLVGISSVFIYQSIQDDKRYESIHQQLFNKYMNQQKNLNILEIGFGSKDGANLMYYPKNNNINLIGIDPSIDIEDKDKINKITKKYLDKNINLELKKESAEKINYPSGYFDIIVSTLVFCTIDNPIKALEECAKVLKPGGVFIAIDHIQSDNDNFLAYQQKLLSPLQEIVAQGCHLDRRTDLLYKEATRNMNNNNNDNILFNKLISLEYFTLNSQYPISRQIVTVLEK